MWKGILAVLVAVGFTMGLASAGCEPTKKSPPPTKKAPGKKAAEGTGK